MVIITNNPPTAIAPTLCPISLCEKSLITKTNPIKKDNANISPLVEVSWVNK